MRSLRSFLLGSSLLAASCLAAAGARAATTPLPVLDFTRDPDVSVMQLSPDGTYESFLHPGGGHLAVCCEPVGSTRATLFDPGNTTVLGGKVSKGVAGYQWVSNDRLLLTTTVWNFIFGVLATNRDGTRVQGISGLEALPVTSGMLVNVNTDALLWATRTIHAFHDRDSSVLMLDQHADRGAVRLYPDVVRVDTMTGTATTVVKNPGNVLAWGTDRAGHVRIGLTADDALHFGLLYRADDHAAWHKLRLPGMRSPEICGFDDDARHLYLYALDPQNHVALYRTSVSAAGAAARSELVFKDPAYDIASERLTLVPRYDGHRLTRVIYSPQNRRLLGVSYVLAGPRTQWADPTFRGYQAAIDHAMPHTVNLCVDISHDEKRLLFLCYSDRDPGTYCLLDVAKKSIVPVGKRMPWINPAQMAQMFPIAYKARDGTPIHGYLTVPVGAPPKHLPLVVLPHGGPWVRDVWGFDPLVQFLANRGYAVLQMNYRGSTGYGQDFYDLGQRQVGRAIQDDIEDGTKWAIAAGIADPHRVAIVGGSYGGYSVLFALAHSPSLYRCGISIAGVTDWLRIFGALSGDEYKYAREYWKENIGDPGADEAMLKRISPVNFAGDIKAPLLVIQGSDDRTVPPSQAHALISAMADAGHKPESLFLSDDGHGLTSPAARRKGFEAIEQFLAAHLGAR